MTGKPRSFLDVWYYFGIRLNGTPLFANLHKIQPMFLMHYNGTDRPTALLQLLYYARLII
jgi:hypothetical protein